MIAVAVGPATAPLTGVRRVPGDKSISHRAAILAALAHGESRVRGFSPAGDCLATLAVLAALGVGVARTDDAVLVDGGGPAGLRVPRGPLDCARSGTTMRLGAGMLAAAPFASTLTGDPQLLRRPMDRVAEPLRLMGAEVQLAEGGRPPLTILGRPLRGMEYRLPVPSAQVKSAILLAGLQASGTTTVTEAVPARDHTERLLRAMGAPVRSREAGAERLVTVEAGPLDPIDLVVPGDFSSAASLLAAAVLLPGSDLVVGGVGLNPGRTGFLGILGRMGAVLEVRRAEDGVEPWGDVWVRHGELQGTTVDAGDVPSSIDELPLLGVVATQAEGVTEVRGAGELRVKESDRIAGLVGGLRALGADAEELPDGFVVRGPVRLRGGLLDGRGDHRLAMAFAVAGLIASEPVRVVGMEFVADSFPGFLASLGVS